MKKETLERNLITEERGERMEREAQQILEKRSLRRKVRTAILLAIALGFVGASAYYFFSTFYSMYGN